MQVQNNFTEANQNIIAQAGVMPVHVLLLIRFLPFFYRFFAGRIFDGKFGW